MAKNIEELKHREIALFERAREYVVRDMKESERDRIYRIAIGEYAWTLEKQLLTPEHYEKNRDEFVAATFTRQGLVDNISYFTPEWEKKIVDRYKSFDTAQHFSKNAIKALEEHFQEQTNEILRVTGETQLDAGKMRYLGNKSYMYNNVIFISFENSPANVTVRMVF